MTLEYYQTLPKDRQEALRMHWRQMESGVAIVNRLPFEEWLVKYGPDDPTPPKYRIELVWNREFNWVSFGKPFDDLELAKKSAIDIRDSGDGARVKKVRVIENDTDKVVWNG